MNKERETNIRLKKWSSFVAIGLDLSNAILYVIMNIIMMLVLQIQKHLINLPVRLFNGQSK